MPGAILTQIGDTPRVFLQAFTISREGNLRVDDEYASTWHALCKPRVDGWYVSDLGSTNRTALIGVPVYRPELLVRGDKLRIGHTTVIVVPSLAWMRSIVPVLSRSRYQTMFFLSSAGVSASSTGRYTPIPAASDAPTTSNAKKTE
jgi:pSer/pThr/pTyr-binding forkhead associated (FHA) protein